MKTRQLLEGSLSSFDPAALGTIYQAFDQAWETIAGNYRNPADIDAARLKLAKALLAVVGENTSNPQNLASLALQMMRTSERFSDRDLDEVPTRPPPRAG